MKKHGTPLSSIREEITEADFLLFIFLFMGVIVYELGNYLEVIPQIEFGIKNNE